MDLKRIKILLLEFLSALGTITGIVLLLRNWNSLPDILPVHFNIYGQPDAYGSKQMLIWLAAVSVFLYGLMSLSAFFPNMINVPWKITDQNREVQIHLAMGLVRLLKVVCTWLFSYLIYGTIQIGTGAAVCLSPYLLPVIATGVLLPIIVYFVRAYQAR